MKYTCFKFVLSSKNNSELKKSNLQMAEPAYIYMQQTLDILSFYNKVGTHVFNSNAKDIITCFKHQPAIHVEY